MSKQLKGLQDFVDHEAGSIVWNASLVLLNHLRANNAADFKGKRVLELGAGIGHLAWGLYEMGAHVTASNTPLDGDLKELQLCVDLWQSQEQDGKVPDGVCI
jgi:predicted RNA methylase